MELDYF